jgi:hypothetical protein
VVADATRTVAATATLAMTATGASAVVNAVVSAAVSVVAIVAAATVVAATTGLLADPLLRGAATTLHLLVAHPRLLATTTIVAATTRSCSFDTVVRHLWFRSHRLLTKQAFRDLACIWKPDGRRFQIATLAAGRRQRPIFLSVILQLP